MFELPLITTVLKKGPAMLSALKESLGAAWKSDKGLMEKISIFISTFQEEWKKLDKEEEEVKDETKKKAGEAVAKTLKPAKDAMKLKKGEVKKPEEDFYNEVLAVGDVNLKKVTKAHPAGVTSGLDKISGAVKDGKDGSFNYDEIASMGSTVAGTVLQLKKDPRYNTEEKFEKMLDRLEKVTVHTDYPLSKLRKFETVGLFKLTDKDEAVKLLGKFGLKPSAGDLIGKGKLSGVKETFEGLKENPPKNVDEMVKIVNEYFLKNSDPDNIKSLLLMANEIIIGNEKSLTNKQLAKMVFLVDNGDLQHLVDVLTS